MPAPSSRYAPVLLALFFAFLACAAAAAAVPKYDTAEVVLHSSLPFNGVSGVPNPFTSVILTLSVTAPDGRTFQVDGFFDGDGNGGGVGDVFKARIFLDQLGTWHWTSSSATDGLGGQSGQIVCSGVLAGAFARGPLSIRGGRPRYFAYADGTPVLVMGKMIDFDAYPLPLTTQTFFSELYTDQDRRAELDYQHLLGVNKMAIYLFNKGDWGGTHPTNPWVGSCSACDKTRFDLAHWRMYETWTRTLRDEGLFAELWFFADNSAVNDFPMADRIRFLRYGMARLSAYVNTVFLVTSEWEEGFTAAELNQAGDAVQAGNPWRRLVSTHSLPGVFDFPDAVWADYMSIQASITGAYQQNHDLALANRLLARKPSLSEEFAQGYESGLSRIKAWSVFTAGQAGTGTGAYLLWLAQFAREVPFYKMDPADSLILTGQAYCLAERGFNYVVYLPFGGPVTLDLTGVSGNFEAQWFDPQTGVWTSAGTVAGGGAPGFVGPRGDDDMVLWLRPLISGSTPPPRVTGLGFQSRSAIDWEDTLAAASYDVVKGNLATLRTRGSFTQSVSSCLENNGTDRAATDAATPASGQALWYLVRATRSNGTNGSYAMGVAGERAGRDVEIAASAARCP